jgi:hypothetical protein
MSIKQKKHNRDSQIEDSRDWCTDNTTIKIYVLLETEKIIMQPCMLKYSERMENICIKRRIENLRKSTMRDEK